MPTKLLARIFQQNPLLHPVLPSSQNPLLHPDYCLPLNHLNLNLNMYLQVSPYLEVKKHSRLGRKKTQCIFNYSQFIQFTKEKKSKTKELE